MFGIIVNDERDERTLAWLREKFTDEQLENAVQKIQATSKRKPYLSNICRALGVEIPVAVRNPAAAEMLKKIQSLAAVCKMPK